MVANYNNKKDLEYVPWVAQPQHLLQESLGAPPRKVVPNIVTASQFDEKRKLTI